MATDSPREVNLAIPMLPDMELTALQTAEAVLRFMAFDAEQIDEVKHALAEGCINAFEHSQSVDRQVYICFTLGDDELVVTVSDFGVGFDPGQVAEPDLQAKLRSDEKRGWGLLLMRSLMDSVDITSSPKGTRITMTKRRSPQ